MMRKVIENEIRGLDFEDLSFSEFIEHVPEGYKHVCNMIHHVDTNLRECGKNVIYPEGLCWRVQGYLTKEEVISLMERKENPIDWSKTASIMLHSNTMEIWTMIVPYEK
jgi:hypothetical protein